MEIAQNESIDIEPAALTEIARQATGSMRDAISLLDQLASTGRKVSLNYAKEVLGTAGNENVIAMTSGGGFQKSDAGPGMQPLCRWFGPLS